MNNNKLTKVYTDDANLRQNAPGLKDYRCIALQRTLVSEHLTKAHKLINVQRWFPEQFKLSKPVEMAVLGATKVSELKALLAEIYVVPLEHIRIDKPFAWKLHDKENLPTLDWQGSKLKPESTLGGLPWRILDGDFIVFKDNREKERVIVTQTSEAGRIVPVRQAERALRMYTPEEQAIREVEEKKKEEDAKKADEVARNDAIKRAAEGKAAATGGGSPPSATATTTATATVPATATPTATSTATASVSVSNPAPGSV